MPLDPIVKTIPGDAPGTSSALTYYRFGPAEAKTKIFMQAALHADEQPGIMVLHHLLPLLGKAEKEGRLAARFTIMPMVNPIGMAQLVFRQHPGRYDQHSGVNFNRRWPNLFDAVGNEVGPLLTEDGAENVKIVRAAVRRWLDANPPQNALQKLRHAVMFEAHDADFVLDLHCDNEALPHIFVAPQLMPDMQDLSDWMGAKATLTAEDSGGGSFDEVWSLLWTLLAEKHPKKPIPQSGRGATLEYRGSPDTFDALGAKDAKNLLGFLKGRGFVTGDPEPNPAPSPGPTPLDATEMLRVDQAGLLAYRVELGDYVKKGQPVADLIALDGPKAFVARTPILAGTSGRILSRNTTKYVWPGCSIAKIVGTDPVPGRAGYLLED